MGRQKSSLQFCSVFCEGSDFVQPVDMSAGFAGKGDGLCVCGDLGVDFT